MNRSFSFGLLLFTALCCGAQEFDPHDPAVIALSLNRASAVVAGKFRVGWCLPWFDGWHCSGAIHVEESLYGDLTQNATVPFIWKGTILQDLFALRKNERVSEA